jgi:hypothetical protein
MDHRDHDHRIFANPGSALRAASRDNPRRFPCPTCHEPDCLTQEDRARGYQCDDEGLLIDGERLFDPHC